MQSGPQVRPIFLGAASGFGSGLTAGNSAGFGSSSVSSKSEGKREQSGRVQASSGELISDLGSRF